MASKWTARKWAGLLLAVGAVQFLLSMVVAESLYPGYSVANNFISDLGVGPTAGLFNGSVIWLGLLLLAAAYQLWNEFKEPAFTLALVLAGWGAIGVGIFSEGSALHLPASFAAFFFGALAAILACRLGLGKVVTLLSALLGIASIVALILFGARITLGIGVGGMERMAAYPILIWAVGAGGFLLANKEG